MSIEAVRKKCIREYYLLEDQELVKLDEEINKIGTRFVKITKTHFNENESKLLINLHQEPASVKNEFFKKHEMEYVHKHLEMLIDLFDYKPNA